MTKSALNTPDVYLIDGSRTPFLKAQSAPGPFKASDLAVNAGRPLLARQPFRPDQLDEVILGCMIPAADEANIGRVVALRLGCGKQVPGWTVQRNCASGMQAVDSARKDIQLGRANLVLAGGTEAMSHSPVLFNHSMVKWLGSWMRSKSIGQKISAITKFRPSMLAPEIALLKGLSDPIVGLSMGQTTEVIAERFDITRTEMDEYAVRSHQRLAAAIDEGLLSEEVETIIDGNGRYYDVDDGLRRDSSVERLAKLRSIFDRPYGKVTAANSSQVTDGSAWCLLASADAVQEHGLKPRAKITQIEWAGLDPRQMGLGPVHATTPILQAHNLSLQDIDYWEINEAFAGQVLGCLAAWESTEYCQQELGLDAAMGSISPDRLNLDGGGVSLGHPVGATGARIILHLLRVLERHDAKRGIATLCIGGGQGGATLIERLEA